MYYYNIKQNGGIYKLFTSLQKNGRMKKSLMKNLHKTNKGISLRIIRIFFIILLIFGYINFWSFRSFYSRSIIYSYHYHNILSHAIKS